jgi:hypothetical protein
MKAEPHASPAVGAASTRRRSVADVAGGRAPQVPFELAGEVARVLAAMSYEERVRAYRSGALTAHELAVAAGRLPEQMPLLNGEFEWIAIGLVDLE